jgi:hypothetical protein
VGEHLILPEGAYAAFSVISEVRGGSRDCDCNIDLRVKVGVVLGDPDKSVHVTSCHGQFLKIVCVPVDVTGALEVQGGLKLDEGLVLLILLYEPEVEFSLESGPGGKRERNGQQLLFSPPSGHILRHEGHGELDKLFLRDMPICHEGLQNQLEVGKDRVEEHLSLYPVAVENGWRVRAKDYFCGWVEGQEV